MLSSLFFGLNHDGPDLHIIAGHLQDVLGSREGVFEVRLTTNTPGTGIEIKR